MWHPPYRSPSSAQRLGFHSVSLCRVFAAELLLALAALVAVLTRIDDTTDGDGISSLGSLNFASDFDDAAHNLMARQITPVPRPLDETGCRDRRRKAGRCYEELAKRFEADGWIVGRVTMEHVVDGVLREIHVADRKGRNVAVAIDPQGKLHYGEDNVLGDHAIAILGEQVSDEYLSELREDGVSYLFAGKDGHDLRSAVDLLGETFGIKTLLLEGGGMINGAFLKNRLIDEISLLVYPASTTSKVSRASLIAPEVRMKNPVWANPSGTSIAGLKMSRGAANDLSAKRGLFGYKRSAKGDVLSRGVWVNS